MYRLKQNKMKGFAATQMVHWDILQALKRQDYELFS